MRIKPKTLRKGSGTLQTHMNSVAAATIASLSTDAAQPKARQQSPLGLTSPGHYLPYCTKAALKLRGLFSSHTCVLPQAPSGPSSCRHVHPRAMGICPGQPSSRPPPCSQGCPGAPHTSVCQSLLEADLRGDVGGVCASLLSLPVSVVGESPSCRLQQLGPRPAVVVVLPAPATERPPRFPASEAPAAPSLGPWPQLPELWAWVPPRLSPFSFPLASLLHAAAASVSAQHACCFLHPPSPT